MRRRVKRESDEMKSKQKSVKVGWVCGLRAKAFQGKIALLPECRLRRATKQLTQQQKAK